MNILYLEIGLESSIFQLSYQPHSSSADCARAVVPNRGAVAPWGAIYSAQGCLGLTRFFIISLKIHFQAVIKPQSKLLWVRHYGCRKLLFFSVGCRKPKKVGKHCAKEQFEPSKDSVSLRVCNEKRNSVLGLFFFCE